MKPSTMTWDDYIASIAAILAIGVMLRGVIILIADLLNKSKNNS